MKAIQVAKYGGPEELQLQEVAQPKPGAGEALIRVHAAGMNYATSRRSGLTASFQEPS